MVGRGIGGFAPSRLSLDSLPRDSGLAAPSLVGGGLSAPCLELNVAWLGNGCHCCDGWACQRGYPWATEWRRSSRQGIESDGTMEPWAAAGAMDRLLG